MITKDEKNPNDLIKKGGANHVQSTLGIKNHE